MATKDKVFDPTQPVRTRDGRKARILCTDRIGRYPIVALVSDELCPTGNETIHQYYENGRILTNGSHHSDLENIPPERYEYQCIYKKAEFPAGRYSVPPPKSENFIGFVKYTFEGDKLIDVSHTLF